MLQNGKHFCLGSSTGDILTGDNLNKNEITLVIDVACAEAMGNPKSVVELLSGCGGIGLVILNFFLELRSIMPIVDFMKGKGNQCAFEGVDALVTQLKSYFLRIMFEWSVFWAIVRCILL